MEDVDDECLDPVRRLLSEARRGNFYSQAHLRMDDVDRGVGFLRKAFQIRLGTMDDMAKIQALENANSHLWREREFLSERQMRGMLENNMCNVLLLEAQELLVGVMWLQRTRNVEAILHSTLETVTTLRHDTGSIFQLLRVNSCEDARHKHGIFAGVELRNFALQIAQASGATEIVAVTTPTAVKFHIAAGAVKKSTIPYWFGLPQDSEGILITYPDFVQADSNLICTQNPLQHFVLHGWDTMAEAAYPADVPPALNKKDSQKQTDGEAAAHATELKTQATKDEGAVGLGDLVEAVGIPALVKICGPRFLSATAQYAQIASFGPHALSCGADRAQIGTIYLLVRAGVLCPLLVSQVTCAPAEAFHACLVLVQTAVLAMARVFSSSLGMVLVAAAFVKVALAEPLTCPYIQAASASQSTEVALALQFWGMLATFSGCIVGAVVGPVLFSHVGWQGMTVFAVVAAASQIPVLLVSSWLLPVAPDSTCDNSQEAVTTTDPPSDASWAAVASEFHPLAWACIILLASANAGLGVFQAGAPLYWTQTMGAALDVAGICDGAGLAVGLALALVLPKCSCLSRTRQLLLICITGLIMSTLMIAQSQFLSAASHTLIVAMATALEYQASSLVMLVVPNRHIVNAGRSLEWVALLYSLPMSFLGGVLSGVLVLSSIPAFSCTCAAVFGIAGVALLCASSAQKKKLTEEASGHNRTKKKDATRRRSVFGRTSLQIDRLSKS